MPLASKILQKTTEKKIRIDVQNYDLGGLVDFTLANKRTTAKNDPRHDVTEKTPICYKNPKPLSFLEKYLLVSPKLPRTLPKVVWVAVATFGSISS